MTEEDLKDLCLCGETTQVQFKEAPIAQKDAAREMIAFANSKGGVMLFGVEDKTGSIKGLSYEQIQEMSRELGNAANEQVKPTIYIETEVVRVDSKHVLVCSVAEGRNKPYKNLQGEIWVKQGADKRRITENTEILALFQDSGSYHPEAVGVTDTTFDDLDRYALDEYLQKVYATSLEGFGKSAGQVLKNIHILDRNEVPTLAGYLFFAKHPEFQCPTLMVKAVSFFGNDLAGNHYRDTKEIYGNMPQIYDKTMAFLKSNLHNVQEKGASFNTLGKLEIAESVLEEVVQNALVHRDLLRSAPIRIFVFDNRVEIISPGALAGGLTEDDIRKGKTYQRNPFMATFATNALHYRGIGSGIVRILAANPTIQIENDAEGQEFKVAIERAVEHATGAAEITTQKDGHEDCNTTQKSTDTTQKNASTTQKDISMVSNTTQKNASTTQKDLDTTQKKVLEYFRQNPRGTRIEAAKAIGNITEDGVKFIISKLQQKGFLKRVGGRKQGEWQVIKD